MRTTRRMRRRAKPRISRISPMKNRQAWHVWLFIPCWFLFQGFCTGRDFSIATRITSHFLGEYLQMLSTPVPPSKSFLRSWSFRSGSPSLKIWNNPGNWHPGSHTVDVALTSWAKGSGIVVSHYRSIKTSQVVVWDFWTIDSMIIYDVPSKIIYSRHQLQGSQEGQLGIHNPLKETNIAPHSTTTKQEKSSS